MTAFLCSSCGAPLSAPDSTPGKDTLCEACGTVHKASTAGDKAAYPLLGRLALSYKFITQDQLAQALAEQRENPGHSLIEIFEKRQMINPSQMELLRGSWQFFGERELDMRFAQNAVRRGYLSRQDADAALEEQGRYYRSQKRYQHIGDLLVAAGKISRIQRDTILIEQKRYEKIAYEPDPIPESSAMPAEPAGLRTTETPSPPVSETDAMDAADTKHSYPFVGRLALTYKFLTEKQLQEALAYKRQAQQEGRKLALTEILEQKGLITPEQMDLLQSAWKFFGERELDIRFGMIAVKREVLSQHAVDSALEDQARIYREEKRYAHIGDLLIEQALITIQQRDSILIEQGRFEHITFSERSTPPAPKSMADAPPPAPGPPEAAGEADEDEDQSEPPPAEEIIIDKGDNLRLTLAPDNMAAFIQSKIKSPLLMTPAEIRFFLSEHGIVHGLVDEQTLEHFLADDTLQRQPFEVAHGTPAVPGQDASLTFHFNRDWLQAGKISADGTIDFKDRGEIPRVAKGALLAEKTPPIPGKPGTDIFGHSVSDLVRDIHLRAGGGAEVSEDGLKVHAQLDGQPEYAVNGIFYVFPELYIKGDIGFETGHVAFDGNVGVQGAVQTGFRVKSANLYASEILEAEIEATGNIIVEGGIIGARIKTMGNVQATFIKDARISAFGNVVVEKQINDSWIETSGVCKVAGGKILSSEIEARRGVGAVDIGTDVSKACRLKVGTRGHLDRQIKALKTQIADLENSIAELRQQVHNIETAKQDLHAQIAKMAMLQDRANIAQREIRKKLHNAGPEADPAAKARLENALLELEARTENTELALVQLFEDQQNLPMRAAAIDDQIESLESQRLDIDREIQTLYDWSREQKPLAIVNADNAIMAGTLLVGRHCTSVVQKTYHNVRMKEVVLAEGAVKGKWGFKVVT